VDRPVLGRHGPGICGLAANDHQRQRGHAQPIGLVAQADVHSESGVPGTGTQAGQQAATGTAAGRHQR